jgi:hypothetical protein
MYDRSLSYDGHTRRFQIKPLDLAGWEVREEQDSRTVSARVYDDWHRVERARSAFQVAVVLLERDSWVSNA